MAKDSDTSATSAERVRYFEGEVLTVDSLRTEQDYFREKLRRHNRLLHGSGVVCGLEVTVDPETGGLAVTVSPGYALGPWGDEICVEEAAPLDLTCCSQPWSTDYPPDAIAAQPAATAQSLLVQIRYVEFGSRPVATLAEASGNETAFEYSRLRDGFALRCIIKPGASEGDKEPPLDPTVPACLASPTDDWMMCSPRCRSVPTWSSRTTCGRSWRNPYNPRMRDIPWSTIALGSLWLISAYPRGGQDVQSPDKSKAPLTTEQRGRILGIGGVFFKSANRDQMREWYSTHLGLTDKGQGATLPWREHDDPQKEQVTVWTVFPSSTNYFGPGGAPFMINYIVDDLDALLTRLKQEGVKIDPKQMNESYGHFAWIYDPDGNKIELWQPASGKS